MQAITARHLFKLSKQWVVCELKPISEVLPSIILILIVRLLKLMWVDNLRVRVCKSTVTILLEVLPLVVFFLIN
jgi:hypothetical protein